MTLPKPCTVPDCPAPITHWHDGGVIGACTSALRGEPCPHGAGGLPCYAPRATNPLHLPDVDAVERAIYESDHCPPWDDESDSPSINWDDELDRVKDPYRRSARAVLDLIAAHQPVWKQVEPGTLIKEGTRYRYEAPNGSSYERIATSDFLSGDGTFIDPRTIPAPTLTERIRAALDDSPEPRITLDVADVEALLDMAGGDPR